MIKKAKSGARRGRPLAFQRDAALEQAMRLFWSRGYEATSVSDLTEAMGISPPSLYGTFGDKKRLFMEAVDRYQAGPGEFARNALVEEPTGERAIRRLLMDATECFSDSRHPWGCMVVLAAINCTIESRDVVNALEGRRSDLEHAVRDRIYTARAAGEIPANTDVDALAGAVTASLYGIAIKARDGASRASLRRIVEQVMLLWPIRSGKVRSRA
ncbi:MAG TPA: TetR/AcrR family transcriptional regulator [Steroidobacteraceae bacterium]|nr:TetR/AcrR family transcriptional regulator [Steroidobacteraceae bacterium]